MLDPKNNFIPQNIKNIHLVAVCGTAMGALASMLKDMGYHVSGSDQKIYPPMSEFLAGKAVPIHEGYHRNNIPGNTDLAVIGNAVKSDNPEVEAVEQRGIAFCSMPQAINHFVAGTKKRLVVTGTHGKTTTASLLAWILFHAGLDPSFVIGGVLRNFNSNYRLGNGEYIVIEGDEYDTAFFDKGPKFFHYPPFAAILTSIEFDHADIFKDLSSVKHAFENYIRKIDLHALVLANDADKNIRQISSIAGYPFVYYGFGEESGWRLDQVHTEPPWTIFEVKENTRFFGQFRSPLMGEHNLLNALAVIAVCRNIGVDRALIKSGLECFEGIKRRQEIRGIKKGIAVMDDFAHHPTAVKETIRAVRPFYPGGRLIAVFEPRTNTSMRNVFQETYSRSFDGADIICVRKPPLLQKIPGSERFCSQRLVKDLQGRGKDARYFRDTDSIIDFLTENAAPGDVVLIMSNGGFDNIHQRLLDKL